MQFAFRQQEIYVNVYKHARLSFIFDKHVEKFL